MSHLTQAAGRSTRRTLLASVLVFATIVAFTFVWIGRASADEGDAPERREFSDVPTGLADAADAAHGRCTKSTDFNNMPAMMVTFSFDGDASPVLVLFQGSFNGDADSSARIRLLIDGVVQPPPGDGVDVHEEDGSVDIATNGFNFISAPLTPGTHTARIQWQATGSDDTRTCVSGRSLIVLHK